MWGVWQDVGKSGGGRRDVWGVWDGLGEVGRSVGEDVSICEERCGCVEQYCVGGCGKAWEDQKRSSRSQAFIFPHKIKGRPKNGLTCFMSYRPLSPLFGFSPPRRRYHPL